MAAESAVRIIFLGDSANAVRSVSRLESSFSGLHRTATLLAGALAIAVVGGFAAATKQALDFQASMDKIRGLVGESQKAVDAYSKAILKMNDVPQGPKELADALFFITSAGIHGAKAINTLHISAKAAGAGLGTVAVVADAVTSAMNAYADANLSASQASDVLVATVREGKTAADALAPSLGRVIAPAHAAGVKFYEVGAAIAAMTRVGLSADESVTALRGLLLAIEAPGGAAAKALQAIGTSGADMQKRITKDGLLSALEFLSSHIKGNLAAGKALIPNVRALAGFLSAMGGNAKATAKIFADLSDATGSTAAASKAAAEGGLFQMHRAIANLQRAAIPIGNLVIPIFGDLAAALSRVAIYLQKIGDAPDIGAKFRVAATGAAILAKDITTALSHALLGYNTWVTTAKGRARTQAAVFHDGLIQEIEHQDWSMIGKKILEGIVAGLKSSLEFGKAVVSNLTAAFGQVNWAALGQQMGPFIVAALAAAISTALDPTFWIHHWDLALSVALVAFGGAIGRVAGRLGLLLLRPFIEAAPRLGAAIAHLVLVVAERLPGPLQRVFLNAAILAGRALNELVAAAAGVMLRVISAIKGKVGDVNGLLRFTLKVLGIDAAIHAVAQFASAAASRIGGAVNAIIGSLHKIPGAVAQAFVIGPIENFIHTLQTVIGWVQTLISFLGRIPHDISVHIHLPHVGLPNIGGILPATGGIVPLLPGSTKSADSVPALLTPGEMVLNRSQQAMLGGQDYLARLFNFSPLERFAAGGIVSHGLHSKKPSKSPHHKKRPRVHTTNKIARRALSAVDAINQTEEDTDRAYGQLVRQYEIADTDLQFIRTDASGNQYISQPDIDQRVGEIDDLINARNQMLALLEEEKKRLKKAIEELQRAIATMVRAIRQEQAAIRDLAKKLSKEKRKKKPNQNLVSAWEAQISSHGTNIGNLTSTIGDFQKAIGDERLNLNHQLNFDKRDVQLDIMQLQQERKDDVGTMLPPGGGGGGGGAGGGNIIGDLLAEIGRLKLALGIQTAQQAVIGSFAKGTLSVPETGLALVHAGESITPAGVPRGGDGAYTPPLHVHVKLSGPLEPLAEFITATVDTPQMADKVFLRMGRSASERQRSGRF